jgi:hypothetical protein
MGTTMTLAVLGADPTVPPRQAWHTPYRYRRKGGIGSYNRSCVDCHIHGLSCSPLRPHHPAWQPGQAEIAAAGGADRSPPRSRPRRCINRAKRTARPGRSTHLPHEVAARHAVAHPLIGGRRQVEVPEQRTIDGHRPLASAPRLGGAKRPPRSSACNPRVARVSCGVRRWPASARRCVPGRRHAPGGRGLGWSGSGCWPARP